MLDVGLAFDFGLPSALLISTPWYNLFLVSEKGVSDRHR
jgi:hypothetical protein